jgi:hypothetical protein
MSPMGYPLFLMKTVILFDHILHHLSLQTKYICKINNLLNLHQKTHIKSTKQTITKFKVL